MPHYEYWDGCEWRDFPGHRDLRWNGKTHDWVNVSDYESPEKAVEIYAARYDSHADYNIVGGSDLILAVREAGQIEHKLYRVSGETVPVYRAEETTLEKLDVWEKRNAELPPSETADPEETEDDDDTD